MDERTGAKIGPPDLVNERSDLPLRPPGNVTYHKVVNSLIGSKTWCL